MNLEWRYIDSTPYQIGIMTFIPQLYIKIVELIVFPKRSNLTIIDILSVHICFVIKLSSDESRLLVIYDRKFKILLDALLTFQISLVNIFHNHYLVSTHLFTRKHSYVLICFKFATAYP